MKYSRNRDAQPANTPYVIEVKLQLQLSQKTAKGPLLCRLETETDPEVLQIMGTPGIGAFRQGHLTKYAKLVTV